MKENPPKMISVTVFITSRAITTITTTDVFRANMVMGSSMTGEV
jgi:hypothetical protein